MEERFSRAWPVTIFRDPCSAGGQSRWVAVACEPARVPTEVAQSCLVLRYWRKQRHRPPCAEGETPDAALANLLAVLEGSREG